MPKPAHCDNCEHSLPVTGEQETLACWVTLEYTDSQAGPCDDFKEISETGDGSVKNNHC